MPRYHLSLGSNLEAEQHLREALRELRSRFGTLQASSIYESEAVGFEGPPFWNLAVGFDSDLDADALDIWLHALEERQGRRRDQPRYADRTLDLDIVAIDGCATNRPELQHAFVLVPLAEIAPGILDPRSGKTIGQLRSQLANTPLRKLEVRVQSPASRAS